MQSLLPGSSKHEVKVVGLQTQICKCVIWTIFGSWSNDVGNIKTSKAFIYLRGRGLGRLNRNGVGQKSLRYFLWVHWSFKILSEGRVMKVFSRHFDPNAITAILSRTSLKCHQTSPSIRCIHSWKLTTSYMKDGGGGGSYKFWRCPRGGGAGS